MISVAASCVLAAKPPAAAAIELGVFNSGAPANAGTVARYTATVGRPPDIVMWYHDFDDPILTTQEMATLKATGQSPMVTWEPDDQSLWSIADGSYDSYLQRSARRASAWEGELMIRFAHEMNGDWYPWTGSPSAYVAAWHHVVTVFREAGAANVRWVWAPNVDRTGSMPFSAYFPGDPWVDYIGLDGYNWGSRGGNHWSSLRAVFGTSYGTITRLSGKPLIITETGSSEVGGDKAAWIRNGFMATIPVDFPRVIAVIWFNMKKEDNWRIDSSQAALDAYREVVNCSLYGGAGPCLPDLNSKPALELVRVTRRVRSSARRSRGVVSYRLSHDARVRIEIHRLKGHRLVRRVAATRGSRAGNTRLPLRRLIGGRGLSAGRYLLTVVAVTENGRRSPLRRAQFRII